MLITGLGLPGPPLLVPSPENPLRQPVTSSPICASALYLSTRLSAIAQYETGDVG